MTGHAVVERSGVVVEWRVKMGKGGGVGEQLAGVVWPVEGVTVLVLITLGPKGFVPSTDDPLGQVVEPGKQLVHCLGTESM